MTSTIRVTVWGENFHEHFERDRAGMAERYPDGMHGAIAAGLREPARRRGRGADRHPGPARARADRRRAVDTTDVLTWWGHAKHAEVDDAVVDRVHQRVLGGMGLLVLHSGHFSKIFNRLMGTTCSLAWRNSADTELVWTVAPAHPIARGVPHPIVIDEQEMYGEYFDIPAPDELVFLSTFSGGEVFRSGCCWRRGKRQGLLLLPRRPGLPGLPPSRHPAGAGQRGAVGPARPGGPTSPRRVSCPSPAPRLAGRLVSEEPPGDRLSAARRGDRSRLGGAAAHGRVRRPARRRPGRRWPGWRPSLLRRAGGAVRGAAGAAVRQLAGPAPAQRRSTCSASRRRPRCTARSPSPRWTPGIHVLSEKPLAENAAMGREMVEAAVRNDRVLDVSFNHRRRGVVKALKQLIDDGRLGAIYYVKAGWLRRQGIPTLGSWFTRRATAGGGPMMDLGVHMLDIVLHLLDEPQVRTVTAATYAEFGPRGRGGSRVRRPRRRPGSPTASSTSRTCPPPSCGWTAGPPCCWSAAGPSGCPRTGATSASTAPTAGRRSTGCRPRRSARLTVWTERDGEPDVLAPRLPPDGEHLECVADFLAGPVRPAAAGRGHAALTRAEVVDACYASAAAGHEVAVISAANS